MFFEIKFSTATGQVDVAGTSGDALIHRIKLLSISSQGRRHADLTWIKIHPWRYIFGEGNSSEERKHSVFSYFFEFFPVLIVISLVTFGWIVCTAGWCCVNNNFYEFVQLERLNCLITLKKEVFFVCSPDWISYFLFWFTLFFCPMSFAKHFFRSFLKVLDLLLIYSKNVVFKFIALFLC